MCGFGAKHYTTRRVSFCSSVRVSFTADKAPPLTHTNLVGD
jgi:hypothetical protein